LLCSAQNSNRRDKSAASPIAESYNQLQKRIFVPKVDLENASLAVVGWMVEKLFRLGKLQKYYAIS
jgi:hypothetical protein